jgi:predicted O-methyltransferase YrrM
MQLLEGADLGARVELIVADSHAEELAQIGDFDLLFVDGDHTRAGALADLEAFLPRLREGGDVLIHDCYPEMEVQQAVFDFLRSHDVHVVRSPYIPSSHWHTDAGSITHFVKPLPPARY